MECILTEFCFASDLDITNFKQDLKNAAICRASLKNELLQGITRGIYEALQ